MTLAVQSSIGRTPIPTTRLASTAAAIVNDVAQAYEATVVPSLTTLPCTIMIIVGANSALLRPGRDAKLVQDALLHGTHACGAVREMKSAPTASPERGRV